MPAPERGEGGGWTGTGVGIGWAQAVGGEGDVAGKPFVKMMRKCSASMIDGRFKFMRLLVTAATAALQLSPRNNSNSHWQHFKKHTNSLGAGFFYTASFWYISRLIQAPQKLSALHSV
jgi:hypothetical protein